MAPARADRLATEGLVERMRQFSRLTLLLVLVVGTVTASGRSIGHTGMHYAGKALAMTMVDLFTSPETRALIKAEFEERTAGFTYQAYIPDGPPPVPKE